MLQLITNTTNNEIAEAILPQLMHVNRSHRIFATGIAHRAARGIFVYRFLDALLTTILLPNQTAVWRGIRLILDYICARVLSRGRVAVSLRKYGAARRYTNDLLRNTIFTFDHAAVGLSIRRRPKICTLLVTEYTFASGTYITTFNFRHTYKPTDYRNVVRFKISNNVYEIVLRAPKLIGVNMWPKKSDIHVDPRNYLICDGRGTSAGELIEIMKAKANSGYIHYSIDAEMFFSGQCVIKPGDSLPGEIELFELWRNYEAIVLMSDLQQTGPLADGRTATSLPMRAHIIHAARATQATQATRATQAMQAAGSIHPYRHPRCNS